jgi:hypothetical protein
MNINGKLQTVLMTHLQKFGSIEILLPDGVILELGITQVGKDGEMEKTEDYCWVVASRNDRQIALDKYNAGIRFSDDDKALVFEDRFEDKDGNHVRRVDVV